MRMICDGTYDGLLTALFYAYKLKPDEILLRPAQQLDMLDAPMQIATDITKSARVQIATTTLRTTRRPCWSTACPRAAINR